MPYIQIKSGIDDVDSVDRLFRLLTNTRPSLIEPGPGNLSMMGSDSFKE
jgi:hypothetical protein